MLSLFLAISALPLPTGFDRGALTPCAPNKHTACAFEGKRTSGQDIPVGKRCHPDPTKAVGCREILPTRDRAEPADQSR